MIIQTTKVYDNIVLNANNRIQIHQGGTSSSKTYSILQYIITVSMYINKPFLWSIVSETMPHLKRGAMRDFFNIIGDSYSVNLHNKSDKEYQLTPFVKVEFFSTDNEMRCRGARRDGLYINECNNIKKSIYDQLEPRTKRVIFLDYNPSQYFWANDLIDKPDTYYRHSTYKDNTFLDKTIIKSILSRKETDPDWWRVYGLGLTGRIDNLVYPNIHTIYENNIPDGRVFYGLDFGFTNDPTSLVKMTKQRDSIYIQELIYQTDLTNPGIVKLLKQNNVPKSAIIYCDSAEPKSIEEIKVMGYRNVKPAFKKIKQGIDFVKRNKIYVTKNSLNIIKEFRNYKYIKNKDSVITNEPIDMFNHSMDALRYSLTHYTKFNHGRVGTVRL